MAKDVGKASRIKRQRAARMAEATSPVPSGGSSGAAPSKGARREGAQRPEAGASPGGSRAALEALRGAAARRVIAADRERQAVDVARASGASWHDVGLVLGMTAEGARQRYSVRASAPPTAEK